MTLTSWLLRWRSGFLRRQPTSRRAVPPSVEALEDRLAPAGLLSLPDMAPEVVKAAVSPTAEPRPGPDLRRVFLETASSPEYWQKVGGTAPRYRAALVNDLLNGRALPASVQGLPLRTRAQRREFLKRLMQTDRFCSVWVQRLANAALEQQTLSPQQWRQALRLIRQPGGFRQTIAFLVNTPQFQAQLQRRTTPPPTVATPTPSANPQAATFTVGTPFVNPYLVNRNGLVPDPVTDPPAWNSGTSASGPIPMQSPWGDAIVLPEVPYSALMTGDAAQPILNLPAYLFNDSPNFTFQTWFQAKSPGALLSVGLSNNGAMVGWDVYTQAPLVYIDANGRLVAGLFDSTPLTMQPINDENPTVFQWKDDLGRTGIGAPNPLRSQASVLDNTWHHVAFVADAQGQSLYLDGALQGTSRPLYHDYYQSQQTSTVSTLTVPLTVTPDADGYLRGSIWQGGFQAYTFEGWLQGDQAFFNLVNTYNAVTVVGSSHTVSTTPPYPVNSITYDASGGTASLQIELAEFSPANALIVKSAYPTANAAYSLTPNTSILALSGQVSVGGTIVPQGSSTPYPQIFYPQGFIGTIDEVAIWNNPLTQAQVQTALSAPVTQAGLTSGLTAYFNFDQTPTPSGWPNQAPGSIDYASGPSTGTMLASVPTTIPTDPFPDALRLSGARPWGLGLMTPLSAPSYGGLVGGVANYFKVALGAGDQLAINLSNTPPGDLSVNITSDTGEFIATDFIISPDQTQYLLAKRTGVYQIEVTWTPVNRDDTGTVNFQHLPGPLNSLAEMLTSYTHYRSINDTEILFAYSDASLAGPNPAAGTAAAGYWPLWSDINYFPIPFGVNAQTWANELSAAYQKLVAHIPTNSGLSDFANIIGDNITLPVGENSIQQALDSAYEAAYGESPPQSAASQTPQEAVYLFLSGANQLRLTFYQVLFGGSKNPGSLQEWVQTVINNIAGSTNIATNIVGIIEDGLDDTVKNLPLTSSSQSADGVVVDALESAMGDLISAVLGFAGPGGAILGAVLGGGSESLANSFSNMGSDSSLTVSVTPITNNLLDYTRLDTVAASINSAIIQQWNSILTTLNNARYVQAVLSNYGLLQALAEMSTLPLTTTFPANNSLQRTLTNASWRTMLPGVFQWKPVDPTSYPTGDGRTTVLPTQSLAGDSTTFNGAWGVVTADFNKDGRPDIAVANYLSSTVTVLFSGGPGPNGAPTFPTVHNYSLNPNSGGPQGITAGDFNGDGYPDLATANNDSDDVNIFLWDPTTNTFQGARQQTLLGPDGAWAITSGDFNFDGHLDLAVANFSGSDSDNVTVLLGDGTGNFPNETIVTYSLQGPDGPRAIVSGHFNHDEYMDLAIADYTSNVVNIMTWLSDVNGFVISQQISISANGPQGLATADFNDDGIPDLAVLSSAYPSNMAVTVMFGNGDGTFNTNATYSIPGDNQNVLQGAIAVRQLNNRPPDLIVGGGSNIGNQGGYLSVLLNHDSGSFLPPINYAIDNIAMGIAVDDFNGDGIPHIAVSTSGASLNVPTDSNVNVLSALTVGNFPTFVADQTGSFFPLGYALSQLLALQGGNTALIPGSDMTSSITPSTSNPPPYLAHISVAYAPTLDEMVIFSPGWFLSMSQATLQQSASGFSYTGSGRHITAWNLFDANGNPIAPSTLKALFGLPIVNPPGSDSPYGSVNLTPINGNKPIVGLNGGWYAAVQPVADAAATWADAFFNWGIGTANYSPRVLLPNFGTANPLTQSGTLLGNSLGFPDDFQYTLTFRPVEGEPPPLEQ